MEIERLQKKEIDYWQRKCPKDNGKNFLENKLETVELEFNYRILEIQKIQEMEINGEKSIVKKHTIIFDDYLGIKNKCLDIFERIIELEMLIEKKQNFDSLFFNSGSIPSDEDCRIFIEYDLRIMKVEEELKSMKEALKEEHGKLDKALSSFDKLFAKSSKENKSKFSLVNFFAKIFKKNESEKDNISAIYCTKCGEKIFID